MSVWWACCSRFHDRFLIWKCTKIGIKLIRHLYQVLNIKVLRSYGTILNDCFPSAGCRNAMNIWRKCFAVNPEVCQTLFVVSLTGKVIISAMRDRKKSRGGAFHLQETKLYSFTWPNHFKAMIVLCMTASDDIPKPVIMDLALYSIDTILKLHKNI